MLKSISKFGHRYVCTSSTFSVHQWRLPKLVRQMPEQPMKRFASASRLFNSFAARELAAPAVSAATDLKIGVQTRTKVPVLIVGAGPVGLSLSILLSKYGIRSMLVERRSALSQHPQAHFVNNRTMEIFRRMEGLESEIKHWQPPPDQWRMFIYCTSLCGPVLGTVDHHLPQDGMDWTSPTSVAHFSQHRLLRLLFKRAERLCMHPANADSDVSLGGILLGHKLVSLEADRCGALARVAASVGSSITLKDVECSYLVATDGAGSSVRHWLGIDMQGEVAIQNLISVHFFSRELGHYLLVNRPAMLYFVFNTSVIAVIVAHNLQLGEFVAQIPYYPPHQVFEDFNKEEDYRRCIWNSKFRHGDKICEEVGNGCPSSKLVLWWTWSCFACWRCGTLLSPSWRFWYEHRHTRCS